MRLRAIDGCLVPPTPIDNTDRVATPFKFYAAFENNRCDGYITEKLWTAYNYGMVPVVWGGCGRADYEKIVPKDSFIHVDDFKSTADLALFLQELDRDDARYSCGRSGED